MWTRLLDCPPLAGSCGNAGGKFDVYVGDCGGQRLSLELYVTKVYANSITLNRSGVKMNLSSNTADQSLPTFDLWAMSPPTTLAPW
jgi:hypothetical protein